MTLQLLFLHGSFADDGDSNEISCSFGNGGANEISGSKK
jgi:hypothetical protein